MAGLNFFIGVFAIIYIIVFVCFILRIIFPYDVMEKRMKFKVKQNEQKQENGTK